MSLGNKEQMAKEAATPGLTGECIRQFDGEPPYRTFRYQVFRVWEQQAEALANGNWGLFPLAPLCDDAPKLMPGLVERMGNRILLEHADSIEGKTNSCELRVASCESAEF